MRRWLHGHEGWGVQADWAVQCRELCTVQLSRRYDVHDLCYWLLLDSVQHMSSQRRERSRDRGGSLGADRADDSLSDGCRFHERVIEEDTIFFFFPPPAPLTFFLFLVAFFFFLHESR